MLARKWLFAVLMVSVINGRTFAFADNDESDMIVTSDGEHAGIQSGNWEFSLNAGAAVPIGNKSINIVANNSAFLISDPLIPGEDEFAENKLTSPDFNGTTTLQGDMQPSFIAQADLYYKLIPWISAGLEGSYIVQHNVNITVGGPFSAPIYNTNYRISALQGALLLRLGDWIEGIRPYVTGGAGPYLMSQKVTSELNDPDDADHPPVQAAYLKDLFGCMVYGGGLDFKIFGSGSVGISVEYMTVFSPNKNLQFVVPTGHFSYYF